MISEGLFGNSQSHLVKHKSVEWYTPSWVFDALGISFDLDPSSPFSAETAVPAEVKYTLYDGGLKKPWFGRVWLNPPYGADTPIWMRRMIHHNNGIALVFSRTDTAWRQEAMDACTAMLFVNGRIEFVPGNENRHKKSRCGAGTVLFAFGEESAGALAKLSDKGIYLKR